ncbi:odorant receptor 4-like [Bombus pascuorum]|uniref:odorant receptor 4-like n=1 Tax=Bombus pascuorum TaxID=65598 RepID=UPI00298ED0B5|nr:odorant receptor 4-like [Bombus pascuorum]
MSRIRNAEEELKHSLSFIYIFGKETNSSKQLKLITPHISCTVQLIKYTFLLYRMHDFKELMEAMKNDWLNATEENRKIFRENAEVGYKVLLGLTIIMYSGSFSNRVIVPLSKGRIVLPDNTTIRPLSSQGYFAFFDAHRTPNYEILFTLQILGAVVMYTILCGSLGLVSLLCIHMSSLLRILANMMIELSDQPDTSENAVHKMIKDIVEYRTKIKKFSDKIEYIMSYISSLEIFNGTCISCVLGYCIIMEWKNSDIFAVIIYVTFQISTIFITFTLCYIGQLLMDESENIRQMSVTLNWYRFSSKNVRCLIPVMIISNYRIKITASNIVDISLATFTDVSIK